METSLTEGMRYCIDQHPVGSSSRRVSNSIGNNGIILSKEKKKRITQPIRPAARRIAPTIRFPFLSTPKRHVPPSALLRYLPVSLSVYFASRPRCPVPTPASLLFPPVLLSSHLSFLSVR